MHVSLIVNALVVMTTLTGPQTRPATNKTPLEGTWLFTTINGQPPAPTRGEVALTVSGTTYEQVSGGKTVEKGTIQVGRSSGALTVDFLPAGPDPSRRVKQLGLCKLVEAALTCKLNQPNAQARPTDLVPEAGFFQFVAKRR